jgi:hypothetical protein
LQAPCGAQFGEKKWSSLLAGDFWDLAEEMEESKSIRKLFGDKT